MDISRELLWLYNKKRWIKLLTDIRMLSLDSVGSDGNLRYIKLSNGKTFFGYKTDATDLFYLGKSGYKANIDIASNEFFGVASDIITRYEYAQPMPTHFSTLDRKTRQIYSKHFANLIIDIDTTWVNLDKDYLTGVFTPRADWVVLDCGAYIGYGSLRLGELVSRVVAFECNQDNIKIIRKNIEANKAYNITLVEKAVWNHNGRVKMGTTEEYQSRSLVYGEEGIYKDTCTIDTVVRALDLRRVDFISLSINGAEYEALVGAKETLLEFKPRLSVTGWVKVNGSPVWWDCRDLLEDLGYKTCLTPDKRILAWW